MSTWEENDNEWYFINATYDDHFVYSNWDESKIFRQGYTKDGDAVSLSDERTELFKEYLTLSEKSELEELRSNYAALQNKINEYESKDKEADAEKYKYFKGFLAQENIYDFERLQDIYTENNKVENSKQLDFILEKFQKESYNTDISKIRDYIGFQEYDKKEITQNDKEKEIKFYELFVEVEYLKQFAKAYYILDKSGGVKYFEYSFK